MNLALFRTLLLSTALLASPSLYWHPPGGQNVFEGVSPDVDAWLFVHTALLLAFPALGLAAFQLLRGVESRAATEPRRGRALPRLLHGLRDDHRRRHRRPRRLRERAAAGRAGRGRRRDPGLQPRLDRRGALRRSR